MTFKAGDVVRLKSNGPLMTIDRMSSSGESCCCIWFSGHILYNGTFFNTALNIHQETTFLPKNPHYTRDKSNDDDSDIMFPSYDNLDHLG